MVQCQISSTKPIVDSLSELNNSRRWHIAQCSIAKMVKWSRWKNMSRRAIIIPCPCRWHTLMGVPLKSTKMGLVSVNVNMVANNGSLSDMVWTVCCSLTISITIDEGEMDTKYVTKSWMKRQVSKRLFYLNAVSGANEKGCLTPSQIIFATTCSVTGVNSSSQQRGYWIMTLSKQRSRRVVCAAGGRRCNTYLYSMSHSGLLLLDAISELAFYGLVWELWWSYYHQC